MTSDDTAVYHPQRGDGAEAAGALPAPADWRTFAEARILGGGEVGLSQGAHGVRLRVGDGETWDLVDTVVVLR